MTNPTNAMQDKVAMVTGATPGLGFVTARALAQRGATVIVVGHNADRGTAAVNRIKRETGSSAVWRVPA